MSLPGGARLLGERSESSRYELIAKLASGGMGSVYVARSRGALGFEHLVAVKRPHPHLLETSTFKATLLEEARIASRIRHGNVVGVRDVVVEGELVYLVMDYIEGASVAQLAEATPQTNGQPLDIPVIIRICLDASAGLHAAHEAADDHGRPLSIVHRDVTPQNILVGTDGISRLTDFGIAKCFGATKEETTAGLVKGKLAYIAPEYARGEPVDRRADIFGLGVVAWELLTGTRLFLGSHDAETIRKLLILDPPAPSVFRPGIPPGVDAVVLKALAKSPAARQATAEEFGEALERAARAGGAVALHREVAASMRVRVGKMLTRRASAVRAAMVEEGTVDLVDVPRLAAGEDNERTLVTEGEESVVVATGVAATVRDASALYGQHSFVVTPEHLAGGAASIARGSASTMVSPDLLRVPTNRDPAPTERSATDEDASPSTVGSPEAEDFNTLLLPPRAPVMPVLMRTMASNALPAPPERAVTAPMAQHASAPPAPTQVMEPTAKREVRIELPMHSRTAPFFVVAVVVLVAGGVLGITRLAGIGPFAGKASIPTEDRAARARTLGAIETGPVAAPSPSVAVSPSVAASSPSVEPAPPQTSAAAHDAHPHGPGGGASGKPGGRAPKAGATASPDPFAAPEASGKLKAAPNPYAQ